MRHITRCFSLVAALIAAAPRVSYARAPHVPACTQNSTVDRNGGLHGDAAVLATPASRHVVVHGVRLHYLDFGGRGEPTILLAGLGSTAWVWSDFAPPLACAGFRVVALTRRGHGDSDAPRSGYALDTLVGDIVAFMDSLGFARANLVGHSVAGAEMTQLAARYPSRVRKLVYIEAAYDRAAQLQVNEHQPHVLPELRDEDRASTAVFFAFQRRAAGDRSRVGTRARARLPGVVPRNGRTVVLPGGHLLFLERRPETLRLTIDFLR
jgi:pimeloyl-ACP methyl ester carboxylesterase